MAKTARGGRKDEVRIEQRRVEAANLYLRGVAQIHIAERLGVTRETIRKDLIAITKAWRESGVRDLDEHKARELAKLDHLERTYWEAWERSCEPEEQTTSEQTRKGDDTSMKAGIRKKGRDGNPAFLEGVMKCIDRRCKLLGVDAPVRTEHEHTGSDVLIVSGDGLTREAILGEEAE